MDPQEGDGVGVTWVTIQSPLEIDFSSISVAEILASKSLARLRSATKSKNKLNN